MKKLSFTLMVLSVVWLCSCERDFTVPSFDNTLVIGYTVSNTGKYTLSSARQANGLKLWMDEVNAAGGITLSNGVKIKFKAILYNDESNNDRVQDLYTQLAVVDKVDILIGPYSSGLTETAAAIAEQNGKLMIIAGAASDAVHKKGYSLIFQTYTPASRYLTGALDLLVNLDANISKIAFVYEDDSFSKDVVNAAKEYAASKGLEIVLLETYPTETIDFLPIINRIKASGAEAIMGGGHFQDGSIFANQIYEQKIVIKFFALLVAPPDPTFANLGDAALGIIGPSQWEPDVAYSPESATAGIEWFGPSVSEFVQAYEAAYNEQPSYHSIGGYAAGMILQKAIISANSVDPADIQNSLNNMDILTCYGRIKFETNTEFHGLQIGHEMVYIQWQKDSGGNLVKVIVWPLEAATGQAVYPKP